MLGACGGDEEPAAAAPGETATAEPAPTEAPPASPEPAPDPAAPNTLIFEFPQGTEQLSFDEGGLARNPVLAATDQGFRWGALVTRDGEVTWVVDGESTFIGEKEISEFASSVDLSRYAYVSDDVVVVDGEQVAEGATGCCPTFSRDGAAFGYIADGSYVVLNGASQEAYAEGVSRLVLSDDGSRSAYVVGGNTVVLDGETQKQYDSISTLTFSADGSRFAHIANEDILVVDGEEREIGESLAEQIAFSPDGSRLAYVKGDLKSGTVILDEEEQKRNPFGCAAILLLWECITFTSDGAGLAYTTFVLVGFGGQSAGGYRVIRDGDPERGLLACCLVASPEGSHVAYVSSRRGVVVDGQALEGVVSIPEEGLVATHAAVVGTEAVGRAPADLVFSGNGMALAFLLFDVGVSPSSITRLYLETLDVP